MSKALTRRTSQPLAVHGYHLSKNADLVLADISASMAQLAGNGTSRWQCLREALMAQTGDIAILAFSDDLYEVATASELPITKCGTNLTNALKRATALEPMHVLVICDGHPNNKDSALNEAHQLAMDCIIDTLYIGPVDDERAIAFMRDLAEVGRGRAVIYDLAQKSAGPLLLTNKIAGLLAGPVDEVVKL